jgi:hypothetical protein
VQVVHIGQLDAGEWKQVRAVGVTEEVVNGIARRYDFEVDRALALEGIAEAQRHPDRIVWYDSKG